MLDLVTKTQEHNLYLILLTMLFSYVYDARTTQNEATPESAWTICSLTPAFSSLDPPPYEECPTSTSMFGADEVRATLSHSIRRALAFPLYRSFALCLKCIEDLCVILRHGRRTVLRALLETRRILDHHEVYYVYSRIWMDDFCRWIAADAKWVAFINFFCRILPTSVHHREEALHALGETVATTTIDKQCIGWDLLALESAVLEQLGRAPDSDDESEIASIPDDSDDESTDSEASSSSSASCSSSSSAKSSAFGTNPIAEST